MSIFYGVVCANGLKTTLSFYTCHEVGWGGDMNVACMSQHAGCYWMYRSCALGHISDATARRGPVHLETSSMLRDVGM